MILPKSLASIHIAKRIDYEKAPSVEPYIGSLAKRSRSHAVGSSKRLYVALVVLSGIFSVDTARAHLGGSLASVAADKAAMASRAQAVEVNGYLRHDLTRPNGGIVREYTNANGVVFAVSWAGPGKPDLRALLGEHFVTMQRSGTEGGRLHRGLRQTLSVDRSGLEIQSGGHMGWFYGAAVLRPLAPAGFTPEDLSQP